MKKYILFISFFLMATLSATEVYADSSRKKYFEKPQIGLWYGPITPVFDTGEHVDPDLGWGGFARLNLPWDLLKVGIDSSYQHYESKGVDDLKLVPAYLNFLFLIPLDFPVRFQIKGGGGLCHVTMSPDNVSQWDPMYMAGVEISFPAGKLANIALRIDYLCIYEKHLKNATENGYVINAGISLYLNLNL